MSFSNIGHWIATFALGATQLCIPVAHAAGPDPFDIKSYLQASHAESGNWVYSPNSLATVLHMAREGANGKTLHELEAALGAPPPAVSDANLEIANRLWVEKTFPIRTDYLERVRTQYSAEAEAADFKKDAEGSRVEINQWVSERTQKKIQDLIPSGAITPLSRVVLVNAVYFKGSWAKPFSKDATHEEAFHSLSGKSILVKMMSRADKSMLYAKGEGFAVVELPYAGDSHLVMDIVLPEKTDGLPALEKPGLSQRLDLTFHSLSPSDVRLSLPRFKISSFLNAGALLKKLGVHDAFDAAQADFSRMTEAPLTQARPSITAVMQKAVIEVNEEGTEAAAASAVIVGTRAIIAHRPILFRADHPFLFLLRDRTSGTVLFVGRVVEAS